MGLKWVLGSQTKRVLAAFLLLLFLKRKLNKREKNIER